MRKGFSDEEYAVVVLQNLKRMLKRSDYMLAFIPPRDLMQDNIDQSDVSAALQFALDCVRERVLLEGGH